MLVMMGLLLLIMCAGLGLISYWNAEKALTAQVDDSLIELAKQGSSKVSAQLEATLNSMEAVAELEVIKGAEEFAKRQEAGSKTAPKL
jgi:methyl-accepting chemotaxis protein